MYTTEDPLLAEKYLCTSRYNLKCLQVGLNVTGMNIMWMWCGSTKNALKRQIGGLGLSHQGMYWNFWGQYGCELCRVVAWPAQKVWRQSVNKLKQIDYRHTRSIFCWYCSLCRTCFLEDSAYSLSWWIPILQYDIDIHRQLTAGWIVSVFVSSMPAEFVFPFWNSAVVSGKGEVIFRWLLTGAWFAAAMCTA